MRKRPAERFFAAILAVFIAVGISLLPIQANAMSLKMDMPLKMDMSDRMMGAMDSSCTDCPKDNADTGMKAVTCGLFCAVPILGVIPDSPSAVATPEKSALSPALEPLLRGRPAAPDPHPPPEADIA